MKRLELPTNVSRAEWGDNSYFGWSVLNDLLKTDGSWSLMSLAVGGRRLSENEAGLLDDVACSITAADPRIYPLKMTRLLSAYGGIACAFAGSQLYFEDALFGPEPLGGAAAQLAELADDLGGPGSEISVELVRGCMEERMAKGGKFIGFGIPVRKIDERVEMLRRCLAARNRENLFYWQLLMCAQEAMLQIRGLPANGASATGAICLDLGFTPDQVKVLSIAFFTHQFLANAIEGAAQAPAELRELPLERIAFVGPEDRTSPRAKAAQR